MQISDKTRNLISGLLIVLAICFICYGIYRGELTAIWHKAVILCMECIGLG